jgi:ubiquinone/menaquinone biosynthesis C-methylase UbiE
VSFADAAHVRAQYATEDGLAARKSIYSEASGVDARHVLFEAVAEARPARVLEVGCGEGELAERLIRELGVALVALDQSARMVELARRRGVDARVGDAQDLPFEDASFDVVVAAWMLYHVADLQQCLEELARVLRPGGRLVAVTNYSDHLTEMFATRRSVAVGAAVRGGERSRAPRPRLRLRRAPRSGGHGHAA